MNNRNIERRFDFVSRSQFSINLYSFVRRPGTRQNHLGLGRITWDSAESPWTRQNHLGLGRITWGSAESPGTRVVLRPVSQPQEHGRLPPYGDYFGDTQSKR
ncbi:hypothetical protein DPMN_042717 [Dreissena polymorpha]|uniref:Uncharacterized protein n=1 Tax=Dreissena polymorpha TaxID=45954 RepID=A0A9D4D021_DREPO|nr:hypothetical protein DPMN_042717 [Dreissena polymorpha]